MVGSQVATKADIRAALRKFKQSTGTKNIYYSNNDDVVSIFRDLTDVPDTYAGAGNFLVRIKSTVDQVEFAALTGTANQIAVTQNAADITLAAIPQFILSDAAAAPYIKLVNASDEERDPIYQLAVGATPIVKWTWGLDDSLDDDWLLCTGDVLTDTPSADYYEQDIALDGYLFVCNSDAQSNTVHKRLAANALTFSAKIGSLPPSTADNNFNRPWAACSDGTYIYVVDHENDRIKKHLISDLSYVAKIGSFGSGDTQFNAAYGICTDGTYLYIADSGNDRVKKHLCSDLSYVAKTSVAGGGHSFDKPIGICTDGQYLYVSQSFAALGGLIAKLLCSDLSAVAHIHEDGHIDDCVIYGLCSAGGYLFLAQENSFTGPPYIFKYTKELVYVSDYGTTGTGDAQFDGPGGIATDGTYLYVADTNNHRIKKHLASDYSFVSKIGSIGADGDDEFYLPWGICLSGPISGVTYTPERGPMLRAKADGTAIESYVSFQLRHELRFRENSVANLNYVGLRAPTSVTSYDLVLPGAAAGAKKHLLTGATNIMAWGQNVDTDGSPSFVRATLTQATGTSPLGITSTTVCTNLNADLLDGNHAAAFALSGHLHAGVYEPVLGNPDVDGKVLSSTAAGVRSWVAAGGAMALDDLTDVVAPTPDDGDVLTWYGGSINAWVSAPPAGGAVNFTDLADVPAAYAGAGGYVVKVNATADGLEFVAGGAGVSSFNDLDDVPASYVGQAGLFCKVKATEDGLEYAAGGAGAPTDAQYITLAVDGTLSAERVLTAGDGVTLVDAGAGSTLTVAAKSSNRHIVETFDGLATGDINGLGSYFQCGAWINNNAATCTTTVAVKSGADKMLRAYAPAGAGTARTELTISSTVGLGGGCRIRWKMRTDQNAANYTGGLVVANAAGTTVASVRFRNATTYKIQFYDGTTYTDLLNPAAANTWYTIDMIISDVSAATGIARIWVDGTYAASAATATLAADIDSVDWYCTNAGAAALNVDCDDLQVYSLMPLFTEL